MDSSTAEADKPRGLVATSTKKKYPVKLGKAYWTWTFLLFGTSSTIVGNGLLNILPALKEIIFPNQSFTGTLLAIYFSSLCIFSLIFLKIKVATCKTALFGLVSLSILSICLPLIVTYVPEDIAPLVLNIYAGFLGFFACLTTNASLTIASTTRPLYVGPVSAGIGLAGLVSFCTWISFSQLVFPSSKEGCIFSLWILFGLCCFLCLVTCVHFTVLSKSNTFSSSAETYDGSCKESSTVSDCNGQQSLETSPICTSVIHSNSSKTDVEVKTDLPEISSRKAYAALFKVIWKLTFIRFLIFFQTFLIFPQVSPFTWESTYVLKSVMIGLLQLFDFVGRYVPSLIPTLIISSNMLYISVIARFLIIGTATLSALSNLRSAFILSHSWFHIIQIIMLGFTNGWLSTVATYHLPASVPGKKAKTQATSAGLSAAFIGVATGQWASKLLKSLL